MPEEAPMRVFIGVHVQRRALYALHKTREALEGVLPPGLTKWDDGGYHLTLRFIGELPWSDVQDLMFNEGVQAGSSRPRFSLTVGDLGMFPDTGPPKVLWAGIYGDVAELCNLQADIDKLVVERTGRKADFPFTPHVTLARFGDMTEEEGERIRQLVRDADSPAHAKWTVFAVDLFASMQTPYGVRYVPIASGLLRNPDHVVTRTEEG